MCSASLFSQQTDSLIHAETQDVPVDSNDSTGNTRISFPGYFVLLGNDFKQDFTSPFHQTSRQWLRTGIYAASITAFSLVADEPIQKFALKLRDNNNALASISNTVTNAGGKYEMLALLAAGGYGFALNNKKLQTTTLLATQAYITSAVIESITKYIAGRQRPSYQNPNQSEPEPTFHGTFLSKDLKYDKRTAIQSFPSGHTTVIFAAATVFAKQYQNVAWVPPVAYSVATLVGLSRITQNAHWTSDVIVGATLGYLCGSQVVNNYHRFLNAKPRSKNTLSFNINYNGKNFEPGFIYTFR